MKRIGLLRRDVGRACLLVLFVALCFFAFAGPALADDCGRDPLNANDCLRTPGTAQVLAGTAATVIAVMVNGFQIVRTVMQPGTGPGRPDGNSDPGQRDKDKEKTERNLLLQIEVKDDQGVPRTSLNVDADDELRVEAWCEEAGKGSLPAATASIRFSLDPTVWVDLTEAGGGAGRRTAFLRTARPEFRGQPPEQITLHVSATFEGQTVNGPVAITLAQRRVRVDVLEPITNMPVPIVHDAAGAVKLRLTLLERSGLRMTAPRGGLALKLYFQDSSRRTPLTSEQEITIEGGQATLDCEYREFDGVQPRNGGGAVELRVTDARGRPVAALGPPRYQEGQKIQFFIVAPLTLSRLQVAIDRVAGSNPTDWAKKREKFSAEVEQAKDIAIDLRSSNGG